MPVGEKLQNVEITGTPAGSLWAGRRVPNFLAHRVCHNDVSHERRIQKQSARATHDVKRRLDPARAHHRHVKCARRAKHVRPSVRCIRLRTTNVGM